MYIHNTSGLSITAQLFVNACGFIEARSSVNDQSILSKLLQVRLPDRRDGILTAVHTAGRCSLNDGV